MITNKRWLELREVQFQAKKKQGLDYLPWADCETLMRRHMTDEEIVPWKSWVDESTLFVQFEGYQPYSLGITDFKNKPISDPSCADVENTRQRCFVKAVARTFGIGHKLYEGIVDGDLAEDTWDNPRAKTNTPSQPLTNKKSLF